MKAVFAELPQDVQEHRRRTGADRWDEMWDGVLHMSPMPAPDHQEFEYQLQTWLRRYWRKRCGGRVLQQVNLAPAGESEWTTNYRIPDLILVSPDRLSGFQETHFAGAPLVAIEIRSPGDDSYEKLPFYAKLGTPEVWIIPNDSREIDLLMLSDGAYLNAVPNDDGWLTSPATGVQFRHQPHCHLEIRLEATPTDPMILPQEDFDLA